MILHAWTMKPVGSTSSWPSATNPTVAWLASPFAMSLVGSSLPTPWSRTTRGRWTPSARLAWTNRRWQWCFLSSNALKVSNGFFFWAETEALQLFGKLKFLAQKIGWFVSGCCFMIYWKFGTLLRWCWKYWAVLPLHVQEKKPSLPNGPRQLKEDIATLPSMFTAITVACRKLWTTAWFSFKPFARWKHWHFHTNQPGVRFPQQDKIQGFENQFHGKTFAEQLRAVEEWGMNCGSGGAVKIKSCAKQTTLSVCFVCLLAWLPGCLAAFLSGCLFVCLFFAFCFLFYLLFLFFFCRD